MNTLQKKMASINNEDSIEKRIALTFLFMIFVTLVGVIANIMALYGSVFFVSYADVGVFRSASLFFALVYGFFWPEVYKMVAKFRAPVWSRNSITLFIMSVATIYTTYTLSFIADGVFSPQAVTVEFIVFAGMSAVFGTRFKKKWHRIFFRRLFLKQKNKMTFVDKKALDYAHRAGSVYVDASESVYEKDAHTQKDW